VYIQQRAQHRAVVAHSNNLHLAVIIDTNNHAEQDDAAGHSAAQINFESTSATLWDSETPKETFHVYA
jgi:hypothetical protein